MNNVKDVVEIDLNPTIGQEQRKKRPCVVVAIHPRLNLITIVPITDASGKSTHGFVKIDKKRAGLVKDSVVDVLQIRTLDVQRVKTKLGSISDSEFDEVLSQLALYLGIDKEHC